MVSKTERLMSVLAFITLLAFLGVLVGWVTRVDLGVVVAATVLLCGYDLFIHKPPVDRT